MTAQERRLRNLVLQTRKYLKHSPGCQAESPWPAAQACTCGLGALYRWLDLERVAMYVKKAS